jgi:hypothetical protein
LIICQHMNGFLMFDPPSILKDLKFLGYYAIMLHQRGIAFYATKDYTEGTSAKISQFLRSFQGMYFPNQSKLPQLCLYANSSYSRKACF